MNQEPQPMPMNVTVVLTILVFVIGLVLGLCARGFTVEVQDPRIDPQTISARFVQHDDVFREVFQRIDMLEKAKRK